MLAALILATIPTLAVETSSHAAVPAMMTVAMKISSFTFPKSLPAGMVQVTATNDTKAEAEIGFGRVNAGYTTKDALAVITANSEQAFIKGLKIITFAGGANMIPPGQAIAVGVNLTPGQYGVVNTSGAKPVYRFFTVTAGSGTPSSAPKATVSVQLKEMSFVGLPKQLHAGAITFKASNVGLQAHDMEFIRLDPGKTKQDVLKALMGNAQPKWAHDAGGMDTLSPQQSAYLTLSLSPGHYAALCFMPDVTAKGTPHALEGMIAEFTVS